MHTLEKYMQQKKLAGRSFFSKLGLAGSGPRKPRQEFEGSALEPFFHVVLRLNGFNCVVKVPHKSQCNNYGIWQGKIKSYLGKVCIFFPTLVCFYLHCFTKNIETQFSDGKHDKHWPLVKTHTLVKENTPRYHKIRQECGFTQILKVAFFCI